ncbi:MAG: hypothetical protein HS114_34570 [Anaerolineales bacterium]|nr:hypothetical protein [Anaerolineales bacterium]
MPPLIEYPAWLNQVNAELSRLTVGLFSAEDFDEPWLEQFQQGLKPEKAAQAALEADGYVIELLPSCFMRQIASSRSIVQSV